MVPVDGFLPLIGVFVISPQCVSVFTILSSSYVFILTLCFLILISLSYCLFPIIISSYWGQRGLTWLVHAPKQFTHNLPSG